MDTGEVRDHGLVVKSGFHSYPAQFQSVLIWRCVEQVVG